MPELRESLFREAFESSPNGVVLLDESARILVSNRRFAEMFGYDVAELVGMSVDRLVPVAARALHERQRAPALQPMTGRVVHDDVRVMRRDGTELPAQVGISPVEVDGQRYLLAAVTDISAQKAAERDLIEREQRLRALMENANDAIAVVGAEDGLIRDVNRKMLELLGVAREQMIGVPARDFSISSGIEELVRTFFEAVEVGNGRLRDSHIRKPDGSVGIIDFSLSLVDVGGERLVIAIGRDVTQERALEEQLRQAQRMEAVGRLAGGIAHDFNNLLTAILGYARLLAHDLPEDDERQPEVAEIIGAGTRATELTRQLLAFSRQQVLEPRVLDLNQIISALHRILQRVIGEDVTIDLELSGDTPSVFADPGQLEQVVMNLVVNARDALTAGGRITIATDCRELGEHAPDFVTSLPRGRYAILRVTDNGTGIAPDVLPKIFDPFFTTKGSGHGTGLGLATVLGIVEQSGGGVRVETEPGVGTTFMIALPGEQRGEAAGAASRTAARELDAGTETPGGGETILLVEDDDAVRRLASEILRRDGYEVIEMPGPEAALSAARERDGIDLLLTDVIMPGASGRSLADALRQSRPELRVLYMSGYTDEVIAFEDLNEPGVSFLQKPFTPEALGARVRALLDDAA